MFRLALVLTVVCSVSISAQYLPSGWRPSGPVFRLPERSTRPSVVYGPPSTSPAPATEAPTEKLVEITTTEAATTTEAITTIAPLGTTEALTTTEIPTTTEEITTNAPTTTELSPESEVTTESVTEEQTEEVTESAELRTTPNYNLIQGETNQVDEIDSSYGAPFKSQFVEQPYQEYGAPQQFDEDDESSEEEIPSFGYNGPASSYGPPLRGSNRKFGLRVPQDTLTVPLNEPAITYGPPVGYPGSSNGKGYKSGIPQPTNGPSLVESFEEDSGLINDEDNGYPRYPGFSGYPYRENLRAASKQKGVYYIYHPTGVLQKITYSTRGNRRNNEYRARYKYENIEPIRGPVYTYDSKSAALKRIS
ncbi:uncharacterized protein LOC143191997 [Rhynchophorus ferrugineus]|uniref:uncharacterized protein LOC143191997 n=1 Tax=Rhynchophorus ferrugineus TaxID=354439 RepID=UPI003FCD7E25